MGGKILSVNYATDEQITKICSSQWIHEFQQYTINSHIAHGGILFCLTLSLPVNIFLKTIAAFL